MSEKGGGGDGAKQGGGGDTPWISDPAQYQPTQAEKREQYHKDLMNKHVINRGGKFQPFSIEHLPHERSRLANPMTAEDRFLRKQWLNDQILHPSEPLRLEELWPRNIFRRMYMAPWNAIQKVMEPFIGERWAIRVRATTPRLMMGAAAFYWMVYHIKYNGNTWEKHGGWSYRWSKPIQYPHEADYNPDQFERRPNDFFDQAFSQRTALLDGKTSRTNYE